MQCFSLVIEYLTGYAVATDAGSREKPEWPPHPARVFMALAAAHFEMDGDAEKKRAEREALEWLATLSPPDLVVPNHTARDVLTVYVPVNDGLSGETVPWRSRQPRVFPRVYVGNEPVRFIWNVDPQLYSTYLESLKSICRHVTRVGHSSSLVWVRIEDHTVNPAVTHTSDQLHGEYSLRLAHAGAVSKLEQAYNGQAIRAFHGLDAKKNQATGMEKKRLQGLLTNQFPQGEPQSQYPNFSIRTNYRRIEPPTPDVPQSLFDPNLIILAEAEEAQQTFGLESTSLVLLALRKFIMSKAPQPLPAWVSGHQSSGEKLQSDPHMALIPLAFVGSSYADGHLMGVGIVFPNSVPLLERARVLSRILFNEQTNSPATLPLVMGKAGEWKIARLTSPPHQQTLKSENYTKATHTWASVTPIVLDRMPKSDRLKDPITWREQTAQIISQSCLNVGLPEPESVRVEKTPFFNGSLRAMPGQGGFPLLTQGRFQVHAVLTFSQPVGGPMLIGAGRFRGYGLCRPWRDDQ